MGHEICIFGRQRGYDMSHELYESYTIYRWVTKYAFFSDQEGTIWVTNYEYMDRTLYIYMSHKIYVFGGYAQRVTVWYLVCGPFIHGSWPISHTKYSSWLISLYITKYCVWRLCTKGYGMGHELCKHESQTIHIWVTKHMTLAGHAKRGCDESRTMSIWVTKYIYVSREIYIFGRLCKKRARYESRTLWNESYTVCMWVTKCIHMSHELCTHKYAHEAWAMYRWVTSIGMSHELCKHESRTMYTWVTHKYAHECTHEYAHESWAMYRWVTDFVLCTDASRTQYTWVVGRLCEKWARYESWWTRVTNYVYMWVTNYVHTMCHELYTLAGYAKRGRALQTTCG